MKLEKKDILLLPYDSVNTNWIVELSQRLPKKMVKLTDLQFTLDVYVSHSYYIEVSYLPG